jgi:hypothetical protein
MGIKKIRENLNDKVRDWGNSKTKNLVRMTGKGFGDFLTMNVNFRKTGATVGALTPVVGLYGLLSNAGGDYSPMLGAIFTPLAYAGTYPISVLFSGLAGAIGYSVGEKVDWAIGDKSPRTWIHMSGEQMRASQLHHEMTEIREKGPLTLEDSKKVDRLQRKYNKVFSKIDVLDETRKRSAQRPYLVVA